MTVTPLNRTLDQELLALSRGASLECPVCGEFILHVAGRLECPECGLRIQSDAAPEVQLRLQAG